MKSPEVIAVIDDSESIRSYLQSLLSDAGYDVLLFPDGLDIVSSLQKKHPDLILLDITMPAVDGYEACRNIKSSPLLENIPIIFLSNNNSTSNIVKGFDSGAVDFVSKPIVNKILLARITTHIALFKLHKKLHEKNFLLENLVSEKVDALYQSQMATITSLANIAEHRDPDTGAHLERVETYCELLARDLSTHPNMKGIINEWFIKLIKYTSCLHDIGKVGIPDAILLKPGKLTDQEFLLMKQHSKLGALTLKKTLETDPENEFIQMGYEIAYYHHEKWDGSGYPKGLVGDEIPISARIMAVADVYDALRSTRCYKKSFSHRKAYSIIDEGSNKHFDPVVVESFIKHEAEFAAIWDRFSEE